MQIADIVWLLIVPILIFSAKPDTKDWVKAARFLMAILLFVFVNFGLDIIYKLYLGKDMHIPIEAILREWVWSLLWILFSCFFYLIVICMYIGLWEFLWRYYHRKSMPFWPRRKDQIVSFYDRWISKPSIILCFMGYVINYGSMVIIKLTLE
jgi:hypothetical protein